MTEDKLEIPSYFSRWYASFELLDDIPRREKRWAGIQALEKSASRKDVDVLIQVAFGLRPPAPSSKILKLREIFQSADETFGMAGNDRELQVLAAASLNALLFNTADIGAVTALALTTASMQGARDPNLRIDLPFEAEKAIQQLSSLRRNRTQYQRLTSRTAQTQDVIAEIESNFASEQMVNALSQLAENINDIADFLSGVDGSLRTQDEEIDMLWWLIGQRSIDFDCQFEALNEDIKPIVLAKELADLTCDLPGPSSIKALLSRAGLKENIKLPLTDMVNAAEESWLEKFMPESEVSPVSAPIHFGLKRRLETGSGTAWITNWSAAAGVPAEIALPPLSFGLLFYRECLLLGLNDE